MKSIFLFATLLGSVLAGCAAAPQDAAQPQANRGELTFRTGSNIPVRDKTSITKDEKEKQAEESRRALQQMQTTGAGNPKIN